MTMFTELKRRKVFRVAVVYAATAFAVLQGADVLLPNLGVPQWVMPFLSAVVVLGFPIALVLGWALELRPDGSIQRTESSAAQPDETPSLLGTRTLLVAAGLVMLGVGLSAGWLLKPGEGPVSEMLVEQRLETAPAPVGPTPSSPIDARADRRTSIAVLPFRAMSSGEDDGYFADGLTEEILNSLAQLPELLVTARTSSFYFKDQDLPVPQIAQTLGVGHVLEGSVRRSGETVRITAQLIRADDGFHLWSDTYDRQLQDVFSVQEDIATSVADALDVVLDAVKLARMQRSGTDDLEAFIAFQKGRELFVAAHENIAEIEEELAAATPLFEQALEASPGWIAAVIYKADALAHTIYGSASGMRSEHRPNEADDALQALRDELDRAWESARPGNQRDILDVERIVFRDDWTGLGGALERAMRPGDCPLTNWTHEFATALGDPVSARDKTDENLLCDPLNALAIFHHAYANIWTGDAQRAIDLAQDAIERGIAYGWIDSIEYWARLSMGDFDHSVVRDARGTDGWWGFPKQLVVAASAGDLETARGYAEDFWTSMEANDQSSMVVAAMIGDRDRANRHAALIDARPGGSVVLNNATYSCLCGAPFELEFTPNFARRVEQAGVAWPPQSMIDFPAKDW